MAARIRLGVVSLSVAAALTAAPVTADAAEELWIWPSSGVLTLAGHGYGHGRGLSQWGAYGAATEGLDSSAILRHYYPGTELATRPDHPIRIWITGDSDGETRIVPTAGVRASAAAGGLTLPVAISGSTVTAWRVVRTASGLVLQGLAAGTWRTQPLGSTSAHPGPISFSTPVDRVRLAAGSTSVEYRGFIQAVGVGTALRTIVVSSLEAYLRSVVPAEMPASWHPQAVRAQAVAARSYASWDRDHPGPGWYDTCDSTACQVFRGVATYNSAGVVIARREYAASDAAVAATAGVVVTFSGQVAFTQFSASNGGWAVAGSLPYQRAFADPYDGVVPSTAHTWTATLQASTLESAYPVLGRLRSLRVLGRDGNGEWGGRVANVVLQGSAGSVSLTGTDFRTVAGLRSTWWIPTNAGRPDTHSFDGDATSDLLARHAGDGSLWLYPGSGTGAFGTPREIGLGWQQMDAMSAVGDLDTDGRPDLVARRAVDGALLLYSGLGAAGFRAARQVGNGWQVVNLIVGVGDLDGDGRRDLVARRASEGSLWLYPGRGDGGFGAARQIGTGWSTMDAVVGSGDWNGDLRMDVIARKSADGSLWLYPGTGTGAFGAARQIGHGWDVMNSIVAPGDWDGDGRGDLVARRKADGSLWLYPGTSSAGLGPSRQIGRGWSVFDPIL